MNDNDSEWAVLIAITILWIALFTFCFVAFTVLLENC